MAELFAKRGEPAHICSDKRPEIIARAVKDLLKVSEVRTLHIEPGCVWENAYSEVFLSRFEEELLKKEVFTSLMEAKILAKGYKIHYYRERCADALSYCTPAGLSLGRCAMWPTWMRSLRRSYNRRPHSHSTWRGNQIQRGTGEAKNKHQGGFSCAYEMIE